MLSEGGRGLLLPVRGRRTPGCRAGHRRAALTRERARSPAVAGRRTGTICTSFPGHRPQGRSVNPAADSSDAFPPGAVGVPPGSRLLRRPVRRTRPSIRTRRRRSLARTGVVGTVVQVNGRAVGTASAASAPRIRNRPGGSAEEAMAAQPLGQPLDEGGEHGPVGPVHAWSWVGATEHRDLMSQHEELDVLGGGRAAHQQDQSEHLLEDQV